MKKLELEERRSLAKIERLFAQSSDEEVTELFAKAKQIYRRVRTREFQEQRRKIETNVVLANRLTRESIDAERIDPIFESLTRLRKAVAEKDTLLATETSASELVTYRVRDLLLAKNYN